MSTISLSILPRQSGKTRIIVKMYQDSPIDTYILVPHARMKHHIIDTYNIQESKILIVDTDLELDLIGFVVNRILIDEYFYFDYQQYEIINHYINRRPNIKVFAFGSVKIPFKLKEISYIKNIKLFNINNNDNTNIEQIANDLSAIYPVTNDFMAHIKVLYFSFITNPYTILSIGPPNQKLLNLINDGNKYEILNVVYE